MSLGLAFTKSSGAGGNRTLVRRAVAGPATTIPESASHGRRTAGSAASRHRRVFPRCQRSLPAVSGLSRRPPLLLLPGCSDQAPRAIPGRDVSHVLTRSGGESEVAIGASLGAPFKESEQLRSHERLPVPTSKPVSPVCVQRCQGTSPRRGRSIVPPHLARPSRDRSPSRPDRQPGVSPHRCPSPLEPCRGGPHARPRVRRSPGACRTAGDPVRARARACTDRP